MKISGKAVVYNHDNISTDQIFPGQYGYIQDMKEMAEHTLEGADRTIRERFRTVGNIFVSGSNFGCGSSREFAVIVLIESGVKAVIVKSAARIWYRNAVNLGLPVLFCPTLPDAVAEGAEVEIDLEKGTVLDVATGALHQGEAPSEFIIGIYREGGIKPLMRKKALERSQKKERAGD
ncbi:MAG TPA: 3-isopropylmalate dehydratase [Syntrophorhabdaceae bacterium]|nr:3-isopropylmalate dehydratase [Syntrophorhabdaceae bacterium]HQM81540.1 3-isopropylmalate dehydratase [Syntrophorhabdaceae bacterium]